jgi:molybdopterin converting factor subunit 1
MMIALRYFAAVRETLGRERDSFDLPEGGTIAELRAMVVTRYPAAQAILARCVAARNRAFAPDATQLSEGDEVVFIPPMAGGAA